MVKCEFSTTAREIFSTGLSKYTPVIVSIIFSAMWRPVWRVFCLLLSFQHLCSRNNTNGTGRILLILKDLFLEMGYIIFLTVELFICWLHLCVHSVLREGCQLGCKLLIRAKVYPISLMAFEWVTLSASVSANPLFVSNVRLKSLFFYSWPLRALNSIWGFQALFKILCSNLLLIRSSFKLLFIQVKVKKKNSLIFKLIFLSLQLRKANKTKVTSLLHRRT